MRKASCAAITTRLVATVAGLAIFIATNATAAVLRVDRISMTVADLGRTEKFYRAVLGFRTVKRERISDLGWASLAGIKDGKESRLLMRLGAQEVEFDQYDKPGKPYPGDSVSQDLWFQHFAIVVGDMNAAYRRLRRVRFTPISQGGPQTLPPQNGSVSAFKFRDPDGHPLELLHFPPGQGRAVWHAFSKSRLFLGIDHTAIGVSATSASLAFYAGLLSLRPAYQSVNEGPRQDALDGVSGALVRVTGLRSVRSDGPGVEFLDYRNPLRASSNPIDLKSNDIAHIHLSLWVDQLPQEVKILQRKQVRFVSPGIVTLKSGARAAMVKDPDGHAILLEGGPSFCSRNDLQ